MTGAHVKRSPLPLERGFAARDILSEAGLRATQQRLALMEILFGGGSRHVCADSLHDELVRSGGRGSISCVYRSLRGFSELGLLKRVPIYGSTTWFDTQVDHHHHYYAVDEDQLFDVPNGHVRISERPEPPEGYELVEVDVVLRIRRKEPHPQTM